jgi:hypothetical protein
VLVFIQMNAYIELAILRIKDGALSFQENRWAPFLLQREGEDPNFIRKSRIMGERDVSVPVSQFGLLARQHNSFAYGLHYLPQTRPCASQCNFDRLASFMDRMGGGHFHRAHVLFAIIDSLGIGS